MKKLLIVIGLVIVLTLAFGGIALANGGPHGGYTADTAACAGCHRAHTAVGEGALLTEEDEYTLCVSCHGDGGAVTNVITGSGPAGAPLNGGGFETMGGTNVTSVHGVEGLNGGTGEGTAWGGANSGTGVTGTLACASCHNPHGSTNYRILKDSHNGYPYNAAAHRWVPNDPELLDWADYQVQWDTTGDTYVAGDVRRVNYTQGMNDFCATCHKQYLTRGHSSFVPSTDGTTEYNGVIVNPYPGTQDALDGKGDVARYRHAVSRTYNPDNPNRPLRFAHAGNDPTTTGYGFTCLTCHYAHGTTASATGFAAGVAPANDSALLYYNNRGVCRSCHQADK